MGRHWQNIKMGKGKADSQRAAKFTQLGRIITLAAKEKGGDPDMNPKLRTAIDKAKEAFMPKDTIDRAVKKGTGELASEAIEELVYEGYGPGGAAILAESITDNRNRTVGSVKNAFVKNGGNMGAAGSVVWMFEHKGVIRIPKESLEDKNIDEIELQLVDLGADDVRHSEGGLEVITSVEGFLKSKEAIRKAGFTVADADLEHVAKDPVVYDPEKHQGLMDLIDALDGDEDVKVVYTNVQL